MTYAEACAKSRAEGLGLLVFVGCGPHSVGVDEGLLVVRDDDPVLLASIGGPGLIVSVYRNGQRGEILLNETEISPARVHKAVQDLGRQVANVQAAFLPHGAELPPWAFRG